MTERTSVFCISRLIRPMRSEAMLSLAAIHVFLSTFLLITSKSDANVGMVPRSQTMGYRCLIPQMAFTLVGATVYYLKAMSWLVAGFSVGSHKSLFMV